jgi:hypothetical protein
MALQRMLAFSAIYGISYLLTNTDTLLPPLILHRTSSAESHFHPTDGLHPILIHTHSSGPLIAYPPAARHALDLSIYSSGECGVSRVSITLDWWSTIGAWGLRYWTTVCAWAVGVIGIVTAHAWNTWEKGGSTLWCSVCVDGGQPY